MSSYLLRKGRVSEDALTGVLADLVAWWPHHAMALLARARRFDGSTVLEPAGFPAHAGQMTVIPWPRWPSGEPDLVLDFARDDGRSVVIIEAKLGAPKSGTDDDDPPIADAAVRDQLAKYFNDAARGHGRHGVALPDRVDIVYLTHHLFPPEDDLLGSHRSLRRSVAGELFWLSWHDLERTISVEFEGAAGGRRQALGSLRAVLGREGYARFDGTWSLPDGVAPYPLPLRVFWMNSFAWVVPGILTPVPGPIFYEQGAQK